MVHLNLCGGLQILGTKEVFTRDRDFDFGTCFLRISSSSFRLLVSGFKPPIKCHQSEASIFCLSSAERRAWNIQSWLSNSVLGDIKNLLWQFLSFKSQVKACDVTLRSSIIESENVNFHLPGVCSK